MKKRGIQSIGENTLGLSGGLPLDILVNQASVKLKSTRGARMKQEKIKIQITKGEDIREATIEETDNGGVLVSTDTSKRGYNSITEAVTELITDCWR